MSLQTILATVEADFAALETWVIDEAETAASDLITLGGHIAQAIEPALFAALQDAAAAAVTALGTGANAGAIFTDVLGRLEPDLQAILSSVESNLASGVVALLASKAGASQPAA